MPRSSLVTLNMYSPARAISPSAFSSRFSTASGESVPRPTSRDLSSSIDGGRMKMSTYPAFIGSESGSARTNSRTFAAPCTSMSRITEHPSLSALSIGSRSVP